MPKQINCIPGTYWHWSSEEVEFVGIVLGKSDVLGLTRLKIVTAIRKSNVYSVGEIINTNLTSSYYRQLKKSDKLFPKCHHCTMNRIMMTNEIYLPFSKKPGVKT